MILVIVLQSYQELQSLVNRADFQEQRVSVLLDIENQKPVMIKRGNANSMEKELVIELIQDMFYPNETSMELFDDYYVAAEWVSGMQWVQITILPTSFMLSTSQGFINVYFILMIITLLLFGFVIVHLKKEEEQRERIYVTDMLSGGLNREGFLRQSRDFLD